MLRAIILLTKTNDMKKIGILTVVLLLVQALSAQILLEDLHGDVIVHNQFYGNQKASNISLIKLNTGSQSLGFNYFTSTVLHDPRKYQIHSYGAKARPTEGYAAVISNGQFSPGINLSYSFTQVSIFSKSTLSRFIDWAGISINYDINRYLLYKRDTAFDSQFYPQNFKGLTISGNYNILINSLWIASINAGYERRNNYGDLTPIEVKDISTYTDPTGTVQRQIVNTTTARQGSYETFDASPITFAITKATPTDDPATAAANQLRFGYSVYVKTLLSKYLPQTDAGVIFFLTKQDKDNGVRSPVFGLNIEANDPFDVQQQKNGLQNRLAVGFTTIFSL